MAARQLSSSALTLHAWPLVAVLYNDVFQHHLGEASRHSRRQCLPCSELEGSHKAPCKSCKLGGQGRQASLLLGRARHDAEGARRGRARVPPARRWLPRPAWPAPAQTPAASPPSPTPPATTRVPDRGVHGPEPPLLAAAAGRTEGQCAPAAVCVCAQSCSSTCFLRPPSQHLIPSLSPGPCSPLP